MTWSSMRFMARAAAWNPQRMVGVSTIAADRMPSTLTPDGPNSSARQRASDSMAPNAGPIALTFGLFPVHLGARAGDVDDHVDRASGLRKLLEVLDDLRFVFGIHFSQLSPSLCVAS